MSTTSRSHQLKNLTYEYEDLSTTDFNSHESKEREWIIPGWLPANRVGLFSGEGEMGKSHLALQLALAVSIQLEEQKSRTKFSLFSKGKLTMVQTRKSRKYADILKSMARSHMQHGKMRFDEMKNRAQNMEKTLNWSDNNGPKYDFIPFDLVGRGPLWAPSDRGSGHISTIASLTPLGKKLRKACEEKKVCLLIIDALASAFGSNENDRGLVRAFMSSWDAWGRK